MRWRNLTGLADGCRARQERAGTSGARAGRTRRRRKLPSFVAPPRCIYCEELVLDDEQKCRNVFRTNERCATREQAEAPK
jgi:hypothetical protein